jgi:hypothetical protein
MFSGGIGSWAAAKRVAEVHGLDNLTLLFTDTNIEDEDLYRFIHEAANNVGVPLTSIGDGRDPWQVFFDERMMGGSRPDPCSRILKRELADRWMEKHFDPTETLVYVGIDWSEVHRYERLRERKAKQGWTYLAPMVDAPYLLKPDMLKWLESEGIVPPRLYGMGFSHNNCGGFCVKGGHGHFALLLREMPERYALHEAMEEEFRQFVGKDVSILRDRRGGKTAPITLRKLRERIQAGCQVDLFDVGGCGCFLDESD